MAMLKLELVEEELQNMQNDFQSTHEVPMYMFIHMGLELEEQQYVAT